MASTQVSGPGSEARNEPIEAVPARHPWRWVATVIVLIIAYFVVLGRTGRNFAAGMSGGIAYVLDEDGSFASRCNSELVGLDPVEEADADALRALVEEHELRTGSPVAASLLADWAASLQRFVKVMPHDYKAALAHSDHPLSTGGEGFLTAETETAEAAA